MTNKKKLFKNISIFLCLVPMLVLSLFCLVPSKQDFNVAAAEVTNDNLWFWGYNVNMPVSTVSTSNSYDLTTIISVTYGFGFENGVYQFNVGGTYLRKDLTSIRTFSHRYTISNSGYSSNVYDLSIPGASGYMIQLKVETGRNFLQPQLVDRVTLDSGTSYAFSSGFVANSVTYSDGSGENYMRFVLQRSYSHFGSLGSTADIFYLFDLPTDTYFFDLVTTEEEGSVYYQQGYTDGYNQGVVAGNQTGYNEGYNAGETIGYENGYNAGVEHGSDYSFMGLIGAVIDAPVSAFTSLLNFELLGVNILGFISGLLTLALIIFIIKLCMGGK